MKITTFYWITEFMMEEVETIVGSQICEVEKVLEKRKKEVKTNKNTKK
jgi:hypothetical protein